MSQCEHHDYTMVEDYIRGLQWSPGTTDLEKGIAIGNIRGFYEHARGLITPPQPADGGDRVGELVEAVRSLLNVSDRMTGDQNEDAAIWADADEAARAALAKFQPAGGEL